MTLMRYRPRTDMFNLRDELNRIFDGFYRGVPDTNERFTTYGPDVDIKETNNDVHISVEIPGIDQKDIKVHVRENVVTLRGEKKRQQEIENTNYHLSERCFGSFERSFTLPTNIQADKVSATYTNGVLNINLPKAEEAKPKEIPVKVV
jgi:HSP20 family protein